ncbi:MAG: hypothetical protein EA384_11015 [Spirochaetaceae bacterium]|nr:MAG: hypothetical protein EA384_11015 [Spirochaetaceae bacterium]
MTLFLDFDGVICDSVLEAYVSSWIAWHRLVCGREPAAVPLQHRTLFYRYRPFIRNGEDFVLLQQTIEEGIAISTQSDFDDRLARTGAHRMQQYRSAIYSVREQLLRDDRHAWLRLNRIYPHVRSELEWLSQRDDCYILSTKKAAYIAEILIADGVDWPARRVLSAEGRSKIDMMAEVLAERSDPHAAFVEDQPDHFPGIGDDPGFRLDCFLAAWGYIQPHWLQRRDLTVIEEADFAPLVRKLLA